MKSLITNYATEKRTGDGKASGDFYMTKFSTGLALDEVVQSHMNKSPEEAKEYVNKHLDNAWAYYDVNNEGYLPVNRVPVLLRKVLGDSELTVDLQ